MMDINLVKQLRQDTGAGLTDCKKALEEADEDLTKAKEILRIKGLAKAGKKGNRGAGEGLVGMISDKRGSVLLELNAETDFVVRNERFGIVLSKLLNTTLNNKGFNDKSALLAASCDDGAGTVQEEINELISIMGENIVLGRFKYIPYNNDSLSVGYIHSKITANAGKMASVVTLKLKDNSAHEAVAKICKTLAMQVVASTPLAISVDDLDPTIIAKERELAIEQARSDGKPDNVIPKIAEGRLKKFYEEVVLLNQPLLTDPKTKVADYLKSAMPPNTATDIIQYEVFKPDLGVTS